MKIVIVINKPAWSLGTLTRLICLGLPDSWSPVILTDMDRERDSEGWERAIRSADVVHWMMHRRFPHESPLTASGHHLVTIHHLEEYEEGDALKCLERCDRIHVVSPRYREELVRRGWAPERVVYIPNPVDDDFFREGSRVRRRKPGSVFRIGFFASAEYEVDRKGIQFLPAISAGLRSAGLAHEIIVSGLGWDHLLRTPEFRGASIRHTLSPSYFDMPKLYGGLDAYLCLSKIEGGPMVVFEALASGTPVVSTTVGAVPEFLEVGRSYNGIPFGDVDGTVAALKWIAEHPDAAQVICREGRQCISRALSLGDYHRSFVRLYSKLAGIIPPEPARAGLRQRLQRRRWRAWDWSYWAKELWVRGEKRRALRLITGSIMLNPLGSGLWRVPVAALRRAVSRLTRHA